ncbi:MAG: hypothetical protein J07HX5_00648, partial [halophilic archaeon J07HX5]
MCYKTTIIITGSSETVDRNAGLCWWPVPRATARTLWSG